MEICDNVFSDHLPVLFEAAVSCAAVKSAAPAHSRRIYNPVTAGQFSAAFNALCVSSNLTSANTKVAQFLVSLPLLNHTGLCGST